MEQLHLGEDKANVLLDVRHQALKVRVGLQVTADGLPHHGVLAHKNNSLAEISIIPHFVVWFT